MLVHLVDGAEVMAAWPELRLHGVTDARFGASERPSHDASGKTP